MRFVGDYSVYKCRKPVPLAKLHMEFHKYSEKFQKFLNALDLIDIALLSFL